MRIDAAAPRNRNTNGGGMIFCSVLSAGTGKFRQVPADACARRARSKAAHGRRRAQRPGKGLLQEGLAFFLLFFESIPEDERTSVLTLYNLINTAAWVGGADETPPKLLDRAPARSGYQPSGPGCAVRLLIG